MGTKKRTILVIFLKELPGKMGNVERKSTRFTAVFFTYLVNSSSASESDIPSFYQANATFLLRKIWVKMRATLFHSFMCSREIQG